MGVGNHVDPLHKRRTTQSATKARRVTKRGKANASLYRIYTRCDPDFEFEFQTDPVNEQVEVQKRREEAFGGHHK